MHQILWKNKIEHEYHLVHGADHVGRTLRGRSTEGLQFLTRVLNPPPPDPAAEALHIAQSTSDAELGAEAERLAYLLKFVRLFFGGIETFLQIEPSALQAFLKLVED